MFRSEVIPLVKFCFHSLELDTQINCVEKRFVVCENLHHSLTSLMNSSHDLKALISQYFTMQGTTHQKLKLIYVKRKNVELTNRLL